MATTSPRSCRVRSWTPSGGPGFRRVRPRTSPGRSPGTPPTGTTRPTSRCSSPSRTAVRPARSRRRSWRICPACGEIERAEVAGPGIPQRFPRARVLPGGARAAPRRGRPVRNPRRGARAARDGGVRQRQPHRAPDARARPAGDPRGLRGQAFAGNGLRHDPRVLLQQRGAPDARAGGVGPRPVPGAPRAAGDVPRGRLPGRLHPGDRGRAPRPVRGVAGGRGTRERLPPGRGGRHLRRHPADARAARHSLRRLLERGLCSTPRGRSRRRSRRSARQGSPTRRTGPCGSASRRSAGRRTGWW